ncbi:MAG: SDR family oxidoreductase [Candidatus Niyogibacteria bacterium]|nr:SDR family oxidoreductase [Candidatus Niyogibacteria bacterium]
MGDKEYIYSLFHLENKVVILTGGLGKIGQHYAEALVRAGGRVAIFDITDEPNEKLKKLAGDFPLLFMKADITDEAQVKRAINAVEQKWETPTILVNNAGWKPAPHRAHESSVPFEDYPVAVWDEVFKINTTGAVICAKTIGKRMIEEKKKGVIINIASHYALVSPDQRVYEYKRKEGKQFVKDASYSASKAALLALTKNLAVEWAPYGIRVVALSPGGVIGPASHPDFIKEYNWRTPLGRMAEADEYNGALLFLASDASRYMTGTNLIIDGGWTAL